jgi:hypothetical protein
MPRFNRPSDSGGLSRQAITGIENRGVGSMRANEIIVHSA